MRAGRGSNTNSGGGGGNGQYKHRQQLALWGKQSRKQREGGFKRGLRVRWGEALTEREDGKQVWSGDKWCLVPFWVRGVNEKASTTQGKREAEGVCWDPSIRGNDWERVMSWKLSGTNVEKRGLRACDNRHVGLVGRTESVHQKMGTEKNRSEIPSGTSSQAPTEMVFVFSSLEGNKWLWGHVW